MEKQFNNTFLNLFIAVPMVHKLKDVKLIFIF